MFYRLLIVLTFSSLMLLGQPAEPGAKAAALGGSFATQHSVFSAKHNVAGLAYLEKNTLAVGARNNYLINDLTDFYALSAFAKGKNCFAMDFLFYGFEAYQQLDFGASYALKLNEDWSLGTRLRYAYNSIPEESVTRHLLTADIGFLGHFNQWRLGANVKNIAQSKWQGAFIEKEPVVFVVGAGYYFETNTALTADFYKAQNTDPDLRIGFNYSPVERLDLRFGFSTLQPTVNFGLGILLEKIEINIAATWHQQLGLSPVTDLVYEW